MVKLLIAAFLCLLTSCNKDFSSNEKERPGPFIIKHFQGNHTFSISIYTISDTETNNEYILTCTGYGVAITPRIK